MGDFVFGNLVDENKNILSLGESNVFNEKRRATVMY